jgi:hypothetical protein
MPCATKPRSASRGSFGTVMHSEAGLPAAGSVRNVVRSVK